MVLPNIIDIYLNFYIRHKTLTIDPSLQLVHVIIAVHVLYGLCKHKQSGRFDHFMCLFVLFLRLWRLQFCDN